MLPILGSLAYQRGSQCRWDALIVRSAKQLAAAFFSQRTYKVGANLTGYESRIPSPEVSPVDAKGLNIPRGLRVKADSLGDGL